MGKFKKAFDEMCHACKNGFHGNCVVLIEWEEENAGAFEFADFMPPNPWACLCYRGGSKMHQEARQEARGFDEEAWNERDHPSDYEVDSEGNVSHASKQRKGDQRLPDSESGGPCVQDKVIEMMQESKRVGVERYGQVLKPFNGRRGIQDLVEEARDLLVYAMQLKMEVDANGEDLFWAVSQGLIEAHRKVPGFSVSDHVVVEKVARLLVDRVISAVALKSKEAE